MPFHNAISSKFVIQTKSTGSGLVDDPNVIAFELSKDFCKRIIIWAGKADCQYNIAFNKGGNPPGVLVHVNTD